MSKQEKPVTGIAREADSDGTEPLPELPDESAGYNSTFVLGSGADAVSNQDPVEQLQAGTVLRDRYLLQERIGTGSMGVVFKALDRHLADSVGNDATVAIKVLAPGLSDNPEALRALQQEAAKGRCLTHPGIVRFIDLDREDDFYFIVMEWLDGQSLADALDSGLLTDDLPRTFDILRQVADALEYAHKRGVVHADIKPGNILLLPDGTARLIDFGIARIRQQDNEADSVPAAIRAATRTYSSMQVLTGETPVVADDVFSLACLAYRMIAGHRVFGPRNAAEAAELGMEPQRPATLSDNQWQALKKGLSHSRVLRQQSPAEFVAELTAAVPDYLTDAPLAAPVAATADRRTQPATRRWPLYTLLFVVLAAVAAFVTNPGLPYQGWVQLRQLVTGADKPSIDSSAASVTAVPDPDDGAPQEWPQPISRTGPTNTAPPAMTQPGVNALDEIDNGGGAAAPPVSGEVSFRSGAGAPAVRETEPSGELQLDLAHAGSPVPRIDVTVMENGDAALITLRRSGGLAEPLLVRIDEVGFSGRRSPGSAGEYVLSGDGVISFDAGIAEARLLITARDDATREVDRTISLTLRDYYNAESVLGQIALRLLDDDQRAFEANLPVNSVAFIRRDMTVREQDPAVQIDIVRFNPDSDTLVVRYFAEDLTAIEGEDYFVPTRRSIRFGPGQRNARLLISLVQDTVPEGDEHFIVQLDPDMTHATTNGRVSVTIRDDDAIAE